jgi:hypothetical protein
MVLGIVVFAATGWVILISTMELCNRYSYHEHGILVVRNVMMTVVGLGLMMRVVR